MRSEWQGFSLIEVLIVAAIIAIIIAAAQPSYTHYVQKSRRADAKICLTEAAARQERLYAETQSYVDNSGLNKLACHADGQSSAEGYYLLSVDVSACPSSPYQCYTITATATGPQASDSDCATFSINHLGQKTSATESDCW